jgi:hypothetical protein
MTLRIAAALIVALLAFSACDDDGASVRDLGGTASGSGSGSGTGAASGSGSGTEAEACEPGDTSDPALIVRLDEYSIVPEEDELTSGPTRFRGVNAGEKTHELYLAAARSLEALPLDSQGSIDTEVLEEEDRLIGELEAIPSGGTCDLEADLEVGTYVLFCNIRERGNDGVVNHFLQGMRARFKVEA